MSCGDVRVGLQQIKEGRSYCLDTKGGKQPLGEARTVAYDTEPLMFRGIEVMKNNKPIYEVSRVDFSKRFTSFKKDNHHFYTHPYHTRGGKRTRKALRKSRRKTSRR
jgi:hypothetical protein